jgi:hypothetical protein
MSLTVVPIKNGGSTALKGGNTMKTTMIVWGLFTLILSFPAQAYQEHHEFKMDAAGIEALKITCGAGKLYVRGHAGATAILVRADIEIPIRNTAKAAKFAREQIVLQLLEDGREAHLKSAIAKKSWSIRNAAVHLYVDIPARMNLDITDGSGSVVLRDLKGNLLLVDGSGEIEIQNAEGRIDIDDGSGEIEIRNVQNQVNVVDGSGGIRIEHVGGDTDIADGSGKIIADTLGGDLTIRDGSGHIEIRRIEGSVHLSDGSGAIDVKDVGGDVVVSRDTSGSRLIADVRGNIVQTP